MSEPYYSDDLVTLYHGDALEMADLWTGADVLVSDPPYGIDYESGHFGKLPRSIANDSDTAVRDTALSLWGDRPALVFGSWRAPRPTGTRMLLPADKWAATVTDTPPVELTPGELALAFDVSRDGAWSTIAVAAGTVRSSYVEVISGA